MDKIPRRLIYPEQPNLVWQATAGPSELPVGNGGSGSGSSHSFVDGVQGGGTEGGLAWSAPAAAAAAVPLQSDASAPDSSLQRLKERFGGLFKPLG